MYILLQPSFGNRNDRRHGGRGPHNNRGGYGPGRGRGPERQDNSGTTARGGGKYPARPGFDVIPQPQLSTSPTIAQERTSFGLDKLPHFITATRAVNAWVLQFTGAAGTPEGMPRKEFRPLSLKQGVRSIEPFPEQDGPVTRFTVRTQVALRDLVGLLTKHFANNDKQQVSEPEVKSPAEEA